MVEPGQLQMYNKPDAHEVFTLPAGVSKHVEYYPDPKMENAGTYIMWLEDHTMGNALRMQLLRNHHVLFAGYRVPHPLINNIELKIQTTENSSPGDALRQAYHELITETKDILSQFQAAMRDRGVPGFPDKAEIADAPARGDDDDDEATSHRFSEISATECADSPHDMEFPQLQDDKRWRDRVDEMQQVFSVCEAPKPVMDPLCVEDIMLMDREVPSTPMLTSASSSHELVPSSRSREVLESPVDSGDFVIPASEGETPVMSMNDVVMSDNVTPSDHVSSAAASSVGFGESTFGPANASAQLSSVYGESTLCIGESSSTYASMEFDEPTGCEFSSAVCEEEEDDDDIE